MKHVKRYTITLTVLALALLAGRVALSHCEIPCGIYDDPARLIELREHASTIEKSIQEIAVLSGEAKPNYNQIVRWVTNKEDHANKFQDIVTQYFMTQRVKPADPNDAEAYKKYVTQVTLLHQMLVTAMKTKQSTDLANVEKLRGLLEQFEIAYFGKKIEAPHTH